jgi:hypothetical protein
MARRLGKKPPHQPKVKDPVHGGFDRAIKKASGLFDFLESKAVQTRPVVSPRARDSAKERSDAARAEELRATSVFGSRRGIKSLKKARQTRANEGIESRRIAAATAASQKRTAKKVKRRTSSVPTGSLKETKKKGRSQLAKVGAKVGARNKSLTAAQRRAKARSIIAKRSQGDT